MTPEDLLRAKDLIQELQELSPDSVVYVTKMSRVDAPGKPVYTIDEVYGNIDLQEDHQGNLQIRVYNVEEEDGW